jgi:hypothetical protein
VDRSRSNVIRAPLLARRQHLAGGGGGLARRGAVLAADAGPDFAHRRVARIDAVAPEAVRLAGGAAKKALTDQATLRVRCIGECLGLRLLFRITDKALIWDR